MAMGFQATPSITFKYLNKPRTCMLSSLKVFRRIVNCTIYIYICKGIIRKSYKVKFKIEIWWRNRLYAFSRLPGGGYFYQAGASVMRMPNSHSNRRWHLHNKSVMRIRITNILLGIVIARPPKEKLKRDLRIASISPSWFRYNLKVINYFWIMLLSGKNYLL